MDSKLNSSNVDKKILRELQKDGRITFSELAK
ncbi:MAG: hypothetical protein CMP84_15260, partial [Gammaproteobacteria bacterium]|nr:hypothetical protein [Gammaproteobacteria bacterium]